MQFKFEFFNPPLAAKQEPLSTF